MIEWLCRQCGMSFMGTVDTPCPDCGSMNARHPERNVQLFFLTLWILVFAVRLII